MAIYNYFGVEMAAGASPNKSLMALDDQTLNGTTGNDKLTSSGAGNILKGGAGDDTYVLRGDHDIIVEARGDGIDTVQLSGARYYEMGANIENMVMNGVAKGIGNDLGNVIIGNSNNQEMDGGHGNDVLTGGGGSDTFIVGLGTGHDLITDFSSKEGDKIRLTDGLYTFDQVKASLHQDGADAILTLSATDSIRIANTKAADLTATDFQFSLDPSKFALTFNEDFDTASTFDKSSSGFRANIGWSSAVTLDNAYVNPNDAAIQALGVNPFSVEDGVLTITASLTNAQQRAVVGDYEYTSGKLSTASTFAQQYGYFEMRAALPQGAGSFPAFWLLPADGNPNPLDRELDVMEQVANGLNRGTAHYAVEGSKESNGTNTAMGDTSDYHTYGMLWTQSEIAWYVDGVEYASMPTPADLNKPMYMIVNLSMGGPWAGPSDTSLGDQSMQVDYVRAYAVPAQATSENINSDHIAAAPVQPTIALYEGTNGADRIRGSADDDHQVAKAGDDTIAGTKGNDIMDGGDGNDTADYSGTTDAVRVDLGITGAQDVGVAGHDTLISIENVVGTKQNDTLIGDSNDNDLDGQGGDDHLYGRAGDDYLNGRAGDDVLEGGSGNDVLNGDGGNDTASYAHATAAVQVSLMLTGVQNTGGAGSDQLIKMENLTGSAYGDTLTGNNAANTLDGGAGNDKLDGGNGADVLIGGSGADILTGGLGNDRFVFNALSDSPLSGGDRITDFKHGGDIIDLSAIDADALHTGNQAFHYIGETGFTHQAGELRKVTGPDGIHVFGDVDGDGVADFHILVSGSFKVFDASDFSL